MILRERDWSMEQYREPWKSIIPKGKNWYIGPHQNLRKRKKSKLLLFAEDIIICKENHTECTQKSIGTIKKWVYVGSSEQGQYTKINWIYV